MPQHTEVPLTIEQRCATALLREHARARSIATRDCTERRTQLDRALDSLLTGSVRAGLTTDQITDALGASA